MKNVYLLFIVISFQLCAMQPPIPSPRTKELVDFIPGTLGESQRVRVARRLSDFHPHVMVIQEQLALAEQNRMTGNYEKYMSAVYSEQLALIRAIRERYSAESPSNHSFYDQLKGVRDYEQLEGTIAKEIQNLCAQLANGSKVLVATPAKKEEKSKDDCGVL
jgi:hypothetical protein